MIVHIALFKLKQESKPTDLLCLTNLVLDLPKQISQLRSVTFGPNLHGIGREQFTHALVAYFDTLEDLTLYRQHPAHQPVSDMVGRIAEARLGVDVETST